MKRNNSPTQKTAIYKGDLTEDASETQAFYARFEL